MKKLVFCLLLLLACPLFAEDSDDNGRLPDGRAYRVDDQGYQLVDYVAELELKVEELQNKIIAINNEQKFKAIDSEFSETNLMAEMKAKNQAACPSCDCPAVEHEACPQTVSLKCPEERECPVAPECSCRDVEDSYKLQIKQADKRLISLQEDLSDKEKVIKNYELAENSSSDNYQQALQDARQQVARLQTRLEAKDQELREYENLAMNRGADLSKNNSQLSEATNKISSLEQEVQRLQIALSAKPVEKTLLVASAPSSQMVSLASEPTEKRSSAFDHLKNKLNGDLASYNQLLTKRQSLYRIYKTLPIKNTISINLSPTETPDGLDADKLQAGINSASKFSELGAIQKNLFVLTRDVRKDLAILQRLTQR